MYASGRISDFHRMYLAEPWRCISLSCSTWWACFVHSAIQSPQTLKIEFCGAWTSLAKTASRWFDRSSWTQRISCLRRRSLDQQLGLLVGCKPLAMLTSAGPSQFGSGISTQSFRVHICLFWRKREEIFSVGSRWCSQWTGRSLPQIASIVSQILFPDSKEWIGSLFCQYRPLWRSRRFENHSSQSKVSLLGRSQILLEFSYELFWTHVSLCWQRCSCANSLHLESLYPFRLSQRNLTFYRRFGSNGWMLREFARVHFSEFRGHRDHSSELQSWLEVDSTRPDEFA
jgi:hypothetical protein